MLVFTYSIWLFLLCLLVAGGVTYALYFYKAENSQYTLIQRRWLAALRFVVTLSLLFFLLKPLVHYAEKVIDRPTLAVLLDNSSSMTLLADSASVALQYAEVREQLNTAFGNEVNIAVLPFGESTGEGQVDFSEKSTDISSALSSVRTSYRDLELGGVVLLSDGIFNVGEHPLYAAENYGYPVYTLCLGDTTPQVDGAIVNVSYNSIAYQGNDFETRVRLRFDELQGEELLVQMEHKGEVVARKNIKVNSPSYSMDWKAVLPATEVGLQSYTVKLSTVEGERIKQNNTKTFYVDVIDGKQKVLILAATAHPDIRALRRTLDKLENLEYEVKTLLDFNELSTTSADAYNLIILHDLPNSQFNNRSVGNWLKGADVSVWSILGNRASALGLREMQWPLRLGADGKNAQKMGASINPSFELFNLNATFIKDNQRKLPPLNGPFADYENVLPGASVLAYQRIGSVETSFPIWAFTQINERKFGWTFGTGIWRWRMFESQQTGETSSFDEWVEKTIQYLAVREQKKRFDVQYERQYREGSNVAMSAVVYNASFEPIVDKEVSLKLSDEDGRDYDFNFLPEGQRYGLNMNRLPAGKYRFTASVNLGDQSITESGEFSISALNLESRNVTANKGVMRGIASKTGGQFIESNSASALVKEIKESGKLTPTYHAEKRLEDLIRLKWLLLIPLLLWAVEWYLRKRWGVI